MLSRWGELALAMASRTRAAWSVAAARSAADGVGGVVNGAERGPEAAGGAGEVCRVSGRAGVGTMRGPAGIVVGEPSGPQDEVVEFGGDRGDVAAVVGAGADGVPVAGDRAEGGPCLAEGVGRAG
jgi:hypothetical protein